MRPGAHPSQENAYLTQFGGTTAPGNIFILLKSLKLDQSILNQTKTSIPHEQHHAPHNTVDILKLQSFNKTLIAANFNIKICIHKFEPIKI